MVPFSGCIALLSQYLMFDFHIEPVSEPVMSRIPHGYVQVGHYVTLHIVDAAISIPSKLEKMIKTTA